MPRIVGEFLANVAVFLTKGFLTRLLHRVSLAINQLIRHNWFLFGQGHDSGYPLQFVLGALHCTFELRYQTVQMWWAVKRKQISVNIGNSFRIAFDHFKSLHMLKCFKWESSYVCKCDDLNILTTVITPDDKVCSETRNDVVQTSRSTL